MRSSTKLLGLGTAFAVVASLGLPVVAAQADVGPSSGDIVGIGSDTVQNIANFLADGDPTGASSGVNSAGGKNRFVSFDATPDANDRAGYTVNGAVLNPTIILRAGTNPVQRPNGSSSGLAAMLKDTTAPYKINWVRMSRFIKSSEITTATNNGWGGLHVVKASSDALKMAAASTTNAPAALTINQLVSIYKCDAAADQWSEVGGTSTATIIPQIPQGGSGTGDTFRADLKAANGGVDVPIGTCVQTVQENDPTSITGSSSPADTIAPFSEGRLNLFNNGYFKDPSVTYGNTPVTLTAGIQLLNGNGAYVDNRGLYFVFRESDMSSAKPFQSGGTLNFAKSLFANPSGSRPYLNTPDGQAAIAAAGGTATYVDCGANPTTC